MSAAPRGEDAGGVALADPVRQRLIQIAADVVGRLPVEEVPPALRGVARFAPAKRQRLGAAALSAALDADDEFRLRVADVVAAASPQLAEAVRDGGSTTASDPIDTAVVAYLTRPDGWTEVLADALQRWSRERGPAAGTDELAQVRAELTRLRAQAKGEAARTRAAITEATAALATELAEAKRQLRGRTADLRSAERTRDEAVAEVGAATRIATAAAATHETELRRVRGRVSELERAAESGRRTVRLERDVDDARLWLLVETIAEAAAGIRREVSLAPPSVRPADGVGRALAVGTGRTAADPAELDRLLALPNLHVIVDGYNVTKTGYGQLPLAEQRTRLLGSMAALASRAGVEITVAFDGAARPPVAPHVPRGLRVLFSAADEIADDLIRRLVAAEPQGRPILVVTSDQEIVLDVRRAGAWTAASAVLLARLDGPVR